MLTLERARQGMPPSLIKDIENNAIADRLQALEAAELQAERGRAEGRVALAAYRAHRAEADEAERVRLLDTSDIWPRTTPAVYEVPGGYGITVPLERKLGGGALWDVPNYDDL